MNRKQLIEMMIFDWQTKKVPRGCRLVWLAVTLMALTGEWLPHGAPAYAYQQADAEGAMQEGTDTAETEKSAKKENVVEEPTDAPLQQTNALEFLINASGPFGGLIFLESFVMVAVIIMCILQIRRQNFLPPEFVEEFEGKVNARDFQGAFESAKRDESLLARLMVVGMTKLQKGSEAVTKAMEELGSDENMGLEHRLSWLALIATTAPMLGLLGTVQGMVQAFDVIASTATQPKPSELAKGIMLALVTTLEGLIVAIPAMISYSLLRNHLTRLMFDVGILSEQLIGRIQTQPAAAGGATPATEPAKPRVDP